MMLVTYRGRSDAPILLQDRTASQVIGFAPAAHVVCMCIEVLHLALTDL
jgi:hypothetical protein